MQRWWEVLRRQRGTFAIWRSPFTSLPARIGCFVFAATLLVSLSVTGLAIDSQRSLLRETLERDFPAVVACGALEFERWQAARAHELDTIGAAPELRDALAALAARPGDPRTRSRARARIDDFLAQALEQHADFASLLVFDASGGDPGWGGLEVEPPDPSRDDPTSGPTAIVEAGDQHLPLLGAAVDTADSSRIGSLYGLPNPSSLATQLVSPHLSPHGRILLVAVEPSPGAGLAGARPDLATLAARPDSPAVSVYTTPAGERVLGSARLLADRKWVIAVEEPYDAALAPVRASTRRLLAINLVMTLVLGLAAYRVAVSIVEPIEALSQAAQQLAEGEHAVDEVAIREPHARDEVALLTRTFNQMAARLTRNSKELKARNAELQRVNETLEQLSITDGLTKLHNHRFFQDHLSREVKRALRSRKPLALVLIDIDNFKSWNDRLGHAAGDEILRRVAAAMNDVIRDSDLLARYGGEEFALVAPNTDLVGAVQLAEKIRSAVAATRYFLEPGSEHRTVTVSIGVASFGGDREALFAAADRCLYRAKANGRDCVIADS